MCGIAGLVQTEPRRIGLASPAEAMQGAMPHRGPDDRGAFVSEDGHCALVHTRLSILDLSPAGHQPMATADGRYWITFNGEIYNFRELRRELEQQGERLASHSDTEVILRLYAREGVACVHRLRGMFAFAIWDARERRLFVARDRLGIKPLYYFSGEGRFVFASEVRAILASGLVPRRIDPVALHEYLAYQAVPAPRTLIRDIRMMPPGTWMTVDASGTIEQHSYWDLLRDASRESHGADRSAVFRRTGELLRESAELHLVSDVPVGVFLSGGIDSSAIVALIRELGVTPRTFSVIFAESNFDESIFARQVAARFRTEHTEIRLTEEGLLAQLPAALAAMDQPSGDGINTYVVSAAVRKAGVKVALSGLGGDELFAGYASFERLAKAARVMGRLKYIPAGMRNAAASMIEMAGGGSIQTAKTAAMISSDGSLAEMYPITREVLSFSKRRSLLSGAWRQLASEWRDPYVALLRAAFDNAGAAEVFARISYAEGRTYMHDVLMRDTDQMSMAHSLEVRVPLLDHKLVEYVMGAPDEWKRSNGTPKSLLVSSLGKLLPTEVTHRPKQGFTLPFTEWMRGEMRAFCEERLHPRRIGSRGIFDAAEVDRLWKGFLAGSRGVSWSRLWVLIALEEWLERNQVDCGI